MKRQSFLQSILPPLAVNPKNHRAGFLLEQVPLTQAEPAQLITAGLFAGPDVRYALVAAPAAATSATTDASSTRYTITYAPEVAGTDLIYNVSHSFLQGKARPFDLSLAPGELALFCILPFQIEGVRGKTQVQTDRSIYVVEFLSGGEKPIKGQLPLVLIEQPVLGNEIVKAYALTDGYGRYTLSLSPEEILRLRSKKSQLQVRSLLCDIRFDLQLTTISK